MYNFFFKKTHCPISKCLLRHTVYLRIHKSEIITKCVLYFINQGISIVQSDLNIRNTVQEKNVNLDVKCLLRHMSSTSHIFAQKSENRIFF